jgi:chemotaxis protein methyltransferase WspC
MLIHPFACLLKERIGLDVEAIGEAGIERAVRERLRVCNLHDPQVYWKQLRSSEAEVQELIEAVVVPETWFFRDLQAFAGLTRYALEEWLPANGAGVLRILSLPCATGEEPFSIAMALLDAGFPEARFEIEAVDISARVIARAQSATYGKNSFRGTQLGFRDRHFSAAGRQYRLHENVRARVCFRQANLFASGAFPLAHAYDVVFCRNVLIYFDPHSRRLAVRLITRLLTQSGILFVGPSESVLPLEQGFVSSHWPMAFAFRRAVGAGVSARIPTARLPSPGAVVFPRSQPSAADASRPLRPAVPEIPTAVSPAPSAVATKPGWIAAARELADVGNLSQAMELCERNFTTAVPTAEAHYLKGLLHDAVGQSQQASEHYRKAVYLDPAHYEALVHLATAFLRDGDVSGAGRLFERARRARDGV